MQAPAIHLWTGASISELEYTFDELIKAYGFIQTSGEACIYKKVSGSCVSFLILYVDDILLIGNDIEFLDSIKGYLNKNFSIKDLGEAAYILGIKIYRDRSRHLIRLSMSTYLDKILKEFKMGQSKEFLPVLQGVKLSKTQNMTTTENRKRMKVIPYASVITHKYRGSQQFSRVEYSTQIY